MSLLEVANVGKAFCTYKTEWHRMANWFVEQTPMTQKWVLRHISFSIKPGEAIGIVGENGAGKSTLLKIITGTLRATEGTVNVKGRISAILELGMGFNPERSGRNNARHTASLMGFNNKVIEQIMPDIEEFAEIGEYFNQPVRTYSSGMKMRVAFAVATALRPDILIVDEALSVGDSYFQHKSFQRIRKFRELGTTLLIVSHDRAAIQRLCDRAILLEKGQVIKDEKPEVVLDFYNALIAEKEKATVQTKTLGDNRVQTSSGTGEAKVVSTKLINQKGNEIEIANVGEDAILIVRARIYVDIPTLVLGYMIKGRLGQELYGTNTWYTEQALHDLKANQQIEYRIHFPMNFGPGSYSVSLALTGSETHIDVNYEWKDLALVFDVVNNDKTKFSGCVWNEPIIEITELTDN